MHRQRSREAPRGAGSAGALPRWIALALAFLCGCGGSAAAPAAALQVFVDGEPRLALARSDVAGPLDLFAALALAPEDALWVEIRGDDARVLKVKTPAERYPERILAAFPTPAGVGVGWVDPVQGELPAQLGGPPPVAFARADEVHVRVTRVEEPRADAPPPPVLRIETSAGAVFELAPSALAALPERTPREVLGLGRGAENLSMTFLGEVLGASLSLADIESVTVHAAAGQSLEVDAVCLSLPAPRAAMLKLNRRGEWRLKLYEPSGSGHKEAAGLRGVTRIEVRLRGR